MELHLALLQKRITGIKTLLDEASLDNRLVEEELNQRVKNNMRLVAEHEHPLAETKDSVFVDPSAQDAGLTSYQLRREIDSVSLDWRRLRNIKECVCSTPFDHFSKKVRTWLQHGPTKPDYGPSNLTPVQCGTLDLSCIT